MVRLHAAPDRAAQPWNVYHVTRQPAPPPPPPPLTARPPPPLPFPPVVKLAKKGFTPSQIGVALRDERGVAQVKSITGQKILRILKAEGVAPELPEDLYHLIKKAVSVRKHLERNRNDKDVRLCPTSALEGRPRCGLCATKTQPPAPVSPPNVVQVSPHSCRVAYSPYRALLQDVARASP